MIVFYNIPSIVLMMVIEKIWQKLWDVIFLMSTHQELQDEHATYVHVVAGGYLQKVNDRCL